MKRLLMLLMLLWLSHACAESPPVMLLPQSHTCLVSVPVGAGEEYRLMALAHQEESAVKLGIATRGDDGIYRVDTLSGMVIPLDAWDSDAAWMQDKWQDGRPFFWWGAEKETKTEEFYLQFEQTPDLGWVVSSGFMTNNLTGVTCQFRFEAPSFVQVSGETISPAIIWPTELSMAVEGFCLHAFAEVCSNALQYLEVFTLEQPFGAQDEVYQIVW